MLHAVRTVLRKDVVHADQKVAIPFPNSLDYYKKEAYTRILFEGLGFGHQSH